MNWLAHLFLSEPNAAFRIGNLLPDLISRAECETLPEQFQRGIRQHYRIDAFTDSHPLVKRSIRRLDPSWRRYGGVLMDLFYDHLLSCQWPAFSEVPLKEFVGLFHAGIEEERAILPAEALAHLDRIRDADLLCSYGTMDGVQSALQRIGRRLRRPIDLGAATVELETHYEGLREDFALFFPELRAAVSC